MNHFEWPVNDQEPDEDIPEENITGNETELIEPKNSSMTKVIVTRETPPQNDPRFVLREVGNDKIIAIRIFQYNKPPESLWHEGRNLEEIMRIAKKVESGQWKDGAEIVYQTQSDNQNEQP
jgi:hypothetical protein